MSCNQYKKWFNEKIKKNPEYDYLTDHLPDPMPHKCPICERHLFRDEWSYDICPYCGWEDDGSEDDDTGKVGCNGMTFSDYKKKYLSLVAKDPNYRWHK